MSNKYIYIYICMYKKNTTTEWTCGATEVLFSPVDISTFEYNTSRVIEWVGIPDLVQY